MRIAKTKTNNCWRKEVWHTTSGCKRAEAQRRKVWRVQEKIDQVREIKSEEQYHLSVHFYLTQFPLPILSTCFH